MGEVGTSRPRVTRPDDIDLRCGDRAFASENPRDAAIERDVEGRRRLFSPGDSTLYADNPRFHLTPDSLPGLPGPAIAERPLVGSRSVLSRGLTFVQPLHVQ